MDFYGVNSFPTANFELPPWHELVCKSLESFAVDCSYLVHSNSTSKTRNILWCQDSLGLDWCPVDHWTFLRPWVKSKFTFKIHPLNLMQHFGPSCGVFPIMILYVTRRNVKIHLLYRLAILPKENKLSVATDSLGLWSVPAEEFFFLSHQSSVTWTRASAIRSLVLGVSSQSCCRGSHALYTDWFPWLHWEWCPWGLEMLLPFLFSLIHIPSTQGRSWWPNTVAIRSEMSEVSDRVVSPTQIYWKGVSMFNSMADKWQRIIEWLSHIETLLSVIISLECPNVPSTNLGLPVALS